MYPLIDSDIIYEDNHLVGINKHPGHIVQGDRTGDMPLSELLKIYLRNKYNKPGNVFAGVIHRLDRPVSGVVLFAKTSKALARMHVLFKEKTIHKTYWAVVKNKPVNDSGTIKNYLLKNERLNKSFVVPADTAGASLSELHYKIIANSDNYYLIEVNPVTGRHHQIRVQLSHIGCPIKGDQKYGGFRSEADGSILLHARKINFLHPVKNEEVEVVANPPKNGLWDYFMSNLSK